MKPKISVIVPVFNVEKYHRECLDSVVNQTLRELEIICVDDGSRDDTWHWIQKGCDLDRARVIGVRFTKNRGKREGLYEGFRRARGEIVVTIDSDSEILPDTLRNLVAPLVADPTVGGVGGNVRVLNEEGYVVNSGFVTADYIGCDCEYYEGFEEVPEYVHNHGAFSLK